MDLFYRLQQNDILQIHIIQMLIQVCLQLSDADAAD